MNNTSTIFHNFHHHLDSPFLHKRVSLIKRPPLVRSSSPTLKEKKKCKKSVRFHDNSSLENVRLFLKTQMPKACRADPACRKKYTVNLRKPNWTGLNTKSHAVRLEDVQLKKLNDTQARLTGTIQVSNLAFEKHVQVIYTLDDWNTVKTLDARYLEPIEHSANTWDRFAFEIELNCSHQTMNLAVKYTVAGREFWDNNHDKNYELDIIPDVQLYELQPEEQDDDTSSDDSDEVEALDRLSLHDPDTPPLSPPAQLSPSTPLSPTTPGDNPVYYFQDNQKLSSLIHSYFFNYPESIHS